MTELFLGIVAGALCVSAICQLSTSVLQYKMLWDHRGDKADYEEQAARNKRHDAVHDSWQLAYDRTAANYQKAMEDFVAKVNVVLDQHAEGHRLLSTPKSQSIPEPKKS